MGKYSPWFPPEINPVHEGLYNAVYKVLRGYLPQPYYWQGKWLDRKDGIALYIQNRYWRGLARKP